MGAGLSQPRIIFQALFGKRPAGPLLAIAFQTSHWRHQRPQVRLLVPQGHRSTPPNHYHLKPISSSGVSDSEPSQAGGRPASSLLPAYAVSGEDQTRGGVTLRSDPRIGRSRPVVSASATGEGMDPHWSDGSVSL